MSSQWKILIGLLICGGGVVPTPAMSAWAAGQVAPSRQEATGIVLLAKGGDHDDDHHRHGRHEREHFPEMDAAPADQGATVDAAAEDPLPPGEAGMKDPVDDQPQPKGVTPAPETPVTQPDGTQKYRFKPYLWKQQPQPANP